MKKQQMIPNTQALSAGSYGYTGLENIVVKTSKDNEPYVNDDVISEVSTMAHLNDKQIPGVPQLYSVSASIDNGIIVPIIRMSKGGRTMFSILSELNPLQRQNYIDRNWDRIIAVLADINSSGIIHGDLHLNNILFDMDQIMIIDFGLSEVIHQFTRYMRSGYYVPERAYGTNNRRARSEPYSDLWIFALSTVRALMIMAGAGDPGITDRDLDNWRPYIQPPMTDQEYAYAREVGGYQAFGNRWIEPPNYIQLQSLREKLRRSLRFNINDRGYNVQPIIPISLWRGYNSGHALFNDYADKLAVIVDQLQVNDYVEYLVYNIVISIDVLRRIMGLDLTNYSHVTVAAAIALISAPVTDYDGTVYAFLAQLGVNAEDCKVIMIKILNWLNWKVKTVDAISLIKQPTHIRTLMDKVLNDKRKYLLMNMSYPELAIYYGQRIDHIAPSI